MSFWSDLIAGTLMLLSWTNSTLLLVGLLLGFLVGALPGFTASNAVAIMLPFTVGLHVESALILMASTYCGAQYGGAVPAILINTPGTPGAAATALEGYPMAQRGEAGKALGIARMASAVGGVASAVIVIFIMYPLSVIALKFGPAEMFMLAVLGLSLIAGVSGKSIVKSLAVGCLGMVIAAMSADPALAEPRLTFGRFELFEGVPFVPVLIGLFAIGEVIFIANRQSFMDEDLSAMPKETWKDSAAGATLALKYPGALMRSTLIGLIIGIIPGTGTAVANFIAYGEEKRWSKHPERFGTGIPEGVIAAEAADNAATSGAMVTTFALGVPGGATAAIMLAALLLHGIQPGPAVMAKSAPMVYAILVTMVICSAAILPFGLLMGEALRQVTRLPMTILIPGITILSLIGAFAVRNSFFDVGLALLFGILGYLMRVQDYPTVPMVLGLILGPIAEAAFGQALMLSRGSYATFFMRPIPAIMWAVILFTLVVQPIIQHYRRRSARRTASTPVS
ncbi:MAG: tripartite tricarboxylate transporter permease [Proteobacteria bacterium]|nr:tripartite tricarboxylate transporter permease [Pseudomonadota bacterium]MBU2226765.1 tripartite tricarboxylate transporter permease [Pseudomonadota bacterium]